MYDLPHFKAKDEAEVIEFMHRHPFAIVAGCDKECKPVATHVPLLIKQIDGKVFLHGHIMKQTGHHKAFAENDDVLAIFSGAHAYVSASWYSDQKQASTWNYLTVHAKGKLHFQDEAFLLNTLKETTATFEKENSPSLFEDLPHDYVQRLIKAIVAFKIEVTSIEHVFKLSQNKDKQSHRNIIEHLSNGSDAAQTIAQEMR